MDKTDNHQDSPECSVPVMSRREREKKKNRDGQEKEYFLSGSLASLAGISCGDGGPISACACDRRCDLGQSATVPEL